MNKTKKVRSFGTLLCLLACALLFAVMPTEREGAVYEETVRLHILAASDKKEDQSYKLEVRDALLATYGEALCGATPDEAKEKIQQLLPDIERTANETLAASGASYGARATLSREWYDTRDYGSFTMPNGYYTSLVISLGEGEGQNWWCVMYPPLCLDIALDAPRDDGMLDTLGGGITQADGGYQVRFKTLELLSSLTKSRNP